MSEELVSKIQVVLFDVSDWMYYVIQEDGEVLDQGGPFPSKGECQRDARQNYPELEFVNSVDETWPPAGEMPDLSEME